MKEYKSIAVTNNREMRRRPEAKVDIRVRMLHSKHGFPSRSKTGKLLQVMKEYRSIAGPEGERQSRPKPKV
jgi:hypothetical protein